MKPMIIAEKTTVTEKGGLPHIMLPGGYAPEDGMGPGDEVQALVTLRLEPDGGACILSVDGAEYEGSAEDEMDSKEPTEMEETPGGKVEEGDYEFSKGLAEAMNRR